MTEKFVEDHEAVCDKCGGVGSVIVKYHSFRKEHIRGKCPKCLGAGKLDWIERITGKKPTTDFFRPHLAAHMYYKGNKLFETTEDGGIKLYG